MPAGAKSLVFAAIVALLPSTAFAQAATALDRFEPAPAGDGSFAVPRASVLGHLRPAAAITLSYAHAPLRVRTYDFASGQTVSQGDVVSRQLVAHLQASLEIARRLKLDLDVPFTITQSGDSPPIDTGVTNVNTPTPQSFLSPSGAAMNDVRLGARLVLLRQHGLLPAASLAYSVWFPSGNAAAYTGTGHFRHAPAIIFGADVGRYSWSVTAGRRVQDSSNGAGLIGSEILGGASLGVRFDKLTANAELFGSTTSTDKSSIATTTPSLELLVGGRYSLGPLTAGLMGGPGLFRGIGTPAFRILATIGVNFDSSEKTPVTETPSGRENAVRPSVTEAQKSHETKPPPPPSAPPPDRDGDTVIDAEDVCPDVPGETAATAARRGCPPDRDEDGFADADDRCPEEKGVATADPERYGCPLDTDADGYPDAVDACPNEKGIANEDPKKRGCPEAVRVEGTQIVILQEVNFATGSDRITPDSFALLQQVAAVLKEHPEIVRVAVDGHTDNAGTEKSNITLSQKRAIAVVTWLVEHGIDSRRLEGRGFGPRRPIASNNTPAGKAKNRRVEFQILKRSSAGSTAWHAGSVQ